MFSGLFLSLYKVLMRENTEQIADRHVVFRGIYCLIAAFFSFVMWVGLWIVTALNDSDCEPEIFSFITWWGLPIFTALFIGIDVIRKSIMRKSAEKFSDNE